MHIHGLLAADFHAHLLRWPGAHSQVGWILALSAEVPGNDGFRWAACIILQVTGFFFFFLSVRYLSSVPSMKEKLVSLSTPDHTHGHTQPGTWRRTCLFNLPPTVRQKERILQDPSDKFQQCNELDCNNSEHLESVRGHLAWVKYYRLVHSRAPGHGCRYSRVVFFSSSTRHSARIENKAERAS